MADEDVQTAAEAEKLLKSRIASRRGKLGVCTRKMNEIKVLLVEGGNVEQVDDCMATLLLFISDFKNVHKAVQELLAGEEKENDHADWYEPRIMNFDYFIKEVAIWKKEQCVQTTVEPKDSVSNISSISVADFVSRYKELHDTTGFGGPRLQFIKDRTGINATQTHSQFFGLSRSSPKLF